MIGRSGDDAAVKKGHAHLEIQKAQLVLDLDGGRGLVGRPPRWGAHLLHWKGERALPNTTATSTDHSSTDHSSTDMAVAGTALQGGSGSSGAQMPLLARSTLADVRGAASSTWASLGAEFQRLSANLCRSRETV